MRSLEFVFVHSFTSKAGNWAEVMLGDEGRSGRLMRAEALAADLGLPLIANDATDAQNSALYAERGIENLNTARNTRDEVRFALDRSARGGVLFVSSPDHLPRIVRDALSLGGTRCLFAASDIPFSEDGAGGVVVQEPAHLK